MDVLRCRQIELAALQALIARYGMQLQAVADTADIPGSFWQAPEAGLIGDILFVRADTPVHSALHESSHYVCMDDKRRRRLHTDAGGREYIEEDATCYLQILLADFLPLGEKMMGRERMFADMDAWGYSFRLGSARRWFEQDADDARQWLLGHGIIDRNGHPTWRYRR